MNNTSTSLHKKNFKKEKIAQHVIDHILDYSKSLTVIPFSVEKKILIINN